jgi:hypothetical protein
MIVSSYPVLPNLRLGMSPAFNFEGWARATVLPTPATVPLKMLPIKVLRCIRSAQNGYEAKRGVFLTSTGPQALTGVILTSKYNLIAN